MMSSRKTNFCKNEDCPSSNELLDFQNGDLYQTRNSEITRHLSSCEFCSAEVDFYERYPQDVTNEPVEDTKIPAPLFELAEALLKNRYADSRSLNALLRETEEPIIDRVI